MSFREKGSSGVSGDRTRETDPDIHEDDAESLVMLFENPQCSFSFRSHDNTEAVRAWDAGGRKKKEVKKQDEWLNGGVVEEGKTAHLSQEPSAGFSATRGHPQRAGDWAPSQRIQGSAGLSCVGTERVWNPQRIPVGGLDHQRGTPSVDWAVRGDQLESWAAGSLAG